MAIDLRKNAGKISLLGFIAFIVSWLIITIALNQNGHMQELTTLFAKMDIAGLKAFYIQYPTPAGLIIADYICIAAYMAYPIALILFFAVRNEGNKVLNAIGKVMIAVALFAGLTDLVETTITTVGAAVDFNIPDTLMKIHIMFTYAKGLIWLAIVWTAVLAIIMLVRRKANSL